MVFFGLANNPNRKKLGPVKLSLIISGLLMIKID